jgi:hypothetical protein
MGLLDFFKFKPALLIEDAFFGQLRFMNFKDPRKNYFEGSGIFSPTGQRIEYLIEANLPGPTLAQQHFYQALQDKYADYVTRIQPLIIGRFRHWQPEFKIQSFADEFTLLSITVPRLSTLSAAWDMSFSTVHDPNHDITIYFLDDQPTSILLDG